MGRKTRGVKHLTGDTFLIDYQAKLERRQERIHADSIAAARLIREERKMGLRKQISLPNSGQERLNATFAEAWPKLEADLKADNVSLKNVQRYTRIFQGLFCEFLSVKFPEITSPNQLRLPFFLEYKTYFINELKRNPNGGWRSELICIKSMMRRLKKLGYCEKDVVEGLTEIKRPNSVKKRYPDVPNEKLKELFAFIKQDNPYFYSPLYFACRTGRRISEVLSIEKQDLEWNNLNPIRINIRGETTKTKRDAPITKLDEGLRQIIANSCRSNGSSAYLFSSKNGKRLKADKVRRYLNQTSVKIVGIRLTPHYFRHRFMTECAKAGVAFADVSNISGIRDPEVMQRHYAHATESGQEAVLEVSKL